MAGSSTRPFRQRKQQTGLAVIKTESRSPRGPQCVSQRNAQRWESADLQSSFTGLVGIWLPTLRQSPFGMRSLHRLRSARRCASCDNNGLWRLSLGPLSDIVWQMPMEQCSRWPQVAAGIVERAGYQNSALNNHFSFVRRQLTHRQSLAPVCTLGARPKVDVISLVWSVRGGSAQPPLGFPRCPVARASFH